MDWKESHGEKSFENSTTVPCHQVLKKDGEKEQMICLRQLIRDNKMPHDGKIYNAYTARVLVKDPIDYIKEEMVCRFIKTSIG